MNAVARGDDPKLFGPRGRVRANKLFRLTSSYTPGIRVLDGGNAEREELYDQLSDLIGRPDALEPESETAQRIAEVEAKLDKLDEPEVEAMRKAFEERLLMPIGAGAETMEKLAKLLEEISERAANNKELASVLEDISNLGADNATADNS